MKIILSPAKKMKVDPDSLAPAGRPVFLEQAQEVLEWLRGKDGAELKALWKCSDAIAGQNIERLREMDLERGLTPAILSYEGIAYQYMAPAVFEDSQLEYVQEHLRILSAFYGVLKPLDGVAPYRLEMQAKADMEGYRDLYDFWGRRLYGEVCGDGIIVNLASREYSRCIEPYLKETDRFITVNFCEEHRGKLVTKGTYAKMARGEMVRFLAEIQAEDPEQIKAFDRLQYVFREDLSDESAYVFERAGKEDAATGKGRR